MIMPAGLAGILYGKSSFLYGLKSTPLASTTLTVSLIVFTAIASICGLFIRFMASCFGLLIFPPCAAEDVTPALIAI